MSVNARTPEPIRPDICVVGADAGGLRVAAQAAAFAVPVVLLPQGGMGGTLLQSGRLPLAALIAAARRAHVMAQAPLYGVEAGQIRIDLRPVQEQVRKVLAGRALNLTRERFVGLGVRVIEGAAWFKNARTLVTANGTEIAARRFVIATGASPPLPHIAGLAEVPHLTSDSLLDLSSCPRRLIVLGAGALGLECAQAFRRLGAEVVVLDHTEPLPQEDRECAAVVLDQLAREGIAIRSGRVAQVEQVPAADPPQIRALLQTPGGQETIEGSHLLVATGRSPNVVGLGLYAAGIRYDEYGIAVDKMLRTTNPRVHAIGEVAGAPPSAHAAELQAGLVIRNALLRLPVRFDPEMIPRAMLTDPELAQIGLTEAQARHRGYRLRVLRWPYRENDRAQAEREARGHIKIATTRRGRILGVTIVGAGAGELLAPWTLAIRRRIPIAAMAGLVVPYPTLSDIGKWAATTYFMSDSTSSWAQRIIALLRRLG